MEITTESYLKIVELEDGTRKAHIRCRVMLDSEEVTDIVLVSGPADMVTDYYNGKINRDELSERLEIRKTRPEGKLGFQHAAFRND